MKSILVALDGTPASMEALKHGIWWAERLDAELRALFVEDENRLVTYTGGAGAEGAVPVAVPLSGPDLAEENAKIATEGEAIHQAYKAEISGHKLESSYSQFRGNVNQLLSDAAHAVDLVVIGKRGMSDPLHPREAGPTTEALIHEAVRPVLVVPEGAPQQGTVVLAFDGSRGVQNALPAGTRMAELLGGRVSVLNVGSDEEQFSRWESILTGYWRPYKTVQPSFLQTGGRQRASEAIVSHAREQSAGMIVMGAFGRSPIREFFFGSTTLEVLEAAPCAVLLKV